MNHLCNVFRLSYSPMHQNSLLSYTNVRLNTNYLAHTKVTHPVIYVIKIKMLSNTAFLLHYRKPRVKCDYQAWQPWNINVPEAYLILKFIGSASERPPQYQAPCFPGLWGALLLLDPGFLGSSPASSPGHGRQPGPPSNALYRAGCERPTALPRRLCWFSPLQHVVPGTGSIVRRPELDGFLCHLV